MIGVPTIRPVALGEQRKRKFLFENYLVTLEIDATPLDKFASSSFRSGPSRDARGSARGWPRPWA